ncbi:heme exporter protein CcmD [Celeribacter sp.]|uniref:heme exporter protein CcmD n=1 Tax=Celeribacter sp. TaxID=1890673 RepID=UPI003A8F0D3E
MMPDLGKYAGDVFAAYGISLLLLALLIWRSWARSRAVKKRLKDAEARKAARTQGL